MTDASAEFCHVLDELVGVSEARSIANNQMIAAERRCEELRAKLSTAEAELRMARDDSKRALEVAIKATDLAEKRGKDANKFENHMDSLRQATVAYLAVSAHRHQARAAALKVLRRVVDSLPMEIPF